jgi:biotin transport system substrate-specific component
MSPDEDHERETMSAAQSTSHDASDTAASGTAAPGTAAPAAPPRGRSTAGDLAQIAVFAALIAALGLPGALYLGGTAVPITFQTLGVMLAGAILGARKGFLAVLLFIALVAAGLPLLSGGRGGLVVFVGPSVGYLLGWLVGAAVIGWFTARLLPRYNVLLAIGATTLGGIVAVYLVGVPAFAAITPAPIGIALLGATAYLPGDILKVVVTVLVAKGVHRAWPGVIAPQPWPWRRSTEVPDAA